MEKLLPRALHQVWIGPAERPVKLMEGWRKNHPDWIYIMWDEESLGDLEMLDGCRKLYERYYAEGCYNGASNVARVEILRQFGGIYIDSDMRCLNSLEPLLVNVPFWIARSPHDNDRPQNGAMGGLAGELILERYAEALDRIGRTNGKISPSWLMSGSGVLQRILADVNCYVLLPSSTFHPHRKDGSPNRQLSTHLARGGVVYADHLFYTTNLLKGKNVFGR